MCARTAQIHRKKLVCEKDGLLLISVIDRGLLIAVRRRVLAFELGINPREASSKRIFRFSTKIVTGIRAGVRDQNILRENIFVWMHISLASRANIRILHNANSRQTRKKEREGRCMEDATIN